MYEVYFDYIDENGTERTNNKKTFSGNHYDIKAHVKKLRKQGYYNITAIKVAA